VAAGPPDGTTAITPSPAVQCAGTSATAGFEKISAPERTSSIGAMQRIIRPPSPTMRASAASAATRAAAVIGRRAANGSMIPSGRPILRNEVGDHRHRNHPFCVVVRNLDVELFLDLEQDRGVIE